MPYQCKYSEQYWDGWRAIALYIAGELKNPEAVVKLDALIAQAISRVLLFPFMYPAKRSTQHALGVYRIIPVANYPIVYSCDKRSREVLIERIVYAPRKSYSEQELSESLSHYHICEWLTSSRMYGTLKK